MRGFEISQNQFPFRLSNPSTQSDSALKLSSAYPWKIESAASDSDVFIIRGA